jgi:hypothetical protein
MFCPECKTEWEEGTVECPICSGELRPSEAETEAGWVRLGTIEDKMSADFAVEVLKSYEISAVVISKSGYFGQVGLTLNPLYSKGSGQFEISVPVSEVEEAIEVLNMALGNSWQREDE